MVISGKCVPYKCVNGGTSEGVMSNVLGFEDCFRSRGSVSMWWKSDSHLRGRLLGIQVWVEVPHWVGMRKLSNI